MTALRISLLQWVLRLAFITGLALVLQGCSVLGSGAHVPLQIYTLDSAVTPSQPLVLESAIAMAGPYEIGQAVLLVNSPSAAPGYDSARMMYVRQPGMLESFTQSAWVDTPARMLTPLLVQSLQRSGQFRAVLAAPSAALADLRLEIAIVRLQHDFLQLPSQVLLSLRGTLVDNSSREVLAWHTFDVRENAPSNDAGGGAAAARAAVQAALLALVQWLKPLAAQPRAID